MAELAEHHLQTEFTDMPVGEILRRTRAHYNQSLDDVERHLRIRAELIHAIEEGDVSRLPGKVYAIGFVRSYSEYLGLDGDKMVALFKEQSAGKTIDPELQFPLPAADSKLPPAWLVLLCIFTLIIVGAYWNQSQKRTRERVETVPAVPAATQLAADNIANPQSPASDENPSQAGLHGPFPGGESASEGEEETISEKPSEGIILSIIESSWVEIKDKSGQTLLSRVLKAGDQYLVPDRPDLYISIGNAAGVEMEVDGQTLRKLGRPAQVRRNIPLNATYLKANYALETGR